MHDPDFDPYLPPRAPVGQSNQTRKGGGAAVPEGNPFATIWLQPRGTIRGIVDSDPTRMVIPLAALAGFSNGLSQMFQKNSGDTLSIPAILGTAAVIGSIGGIIGLYIGGALLRMTGGWLGGTANGEEVRAAVAWGSVPNIAALPLLLLGVAIFGEKMFRTNGLDASSPQEGVILLVLGLSMMILGVWGFFTGLTCVAEVHRFSAWRALGSILLVGLFVFALILLIMVLVVGFTAAMKAGG